jgi:ubiquinone/menaquinone biosynthesis C-methylase UbiE
MSSITEKSLEDRKLKEVEHSDRRRSIVTGFEYMTDASCGSNFEELVTDKEAYEKHFSNMKFYSISRTSFTYRDECLLSNLKGSIALDYCCGNGEVAIKMAQQGAKKVYGIDLSPVAVENATALAEKNGVGDICEFKVMDAEHMEFPDDYFDIVHEYGALHHLELKAAFPELARVLKPKGKIVCTETLRHNPLIHWYRRRTPTLRTEWEVEHILGFPEIYSAHKHFNDIGVRTFHLTALGAVPFRKTCLFRPLLFAFEIVDKIILSIPLLRRMAWVAVIEYKNPIKNDQ